MVFNRTLWIGGDGVKQRILCLLLFLGMMTLTGCTMDNAQWVVSNDVESVKPRKGIALNVKNFEGYQGFEWIDQDHMMVYKQSDTVFGTDRGLGILNVQNGKVDHYIKTQKKPRRVIQSPDGNGIVYSLASEGVTYGYLVFQDLKTGKEKTYPYDAWAFEMQKPWQKGRDLLLPDSENEMNLWRMNQDGIVKRFELPLPQGFKKENAMFINSGFESSKKIYGVISGYQFSEMMVYDKESQKSLFYSEKNVIDAGINPTNELLYLIQRGKAYDDETLSFVDETSQVIPLVTHKNIGMAEWSPNGRYLLYTIETPQNETEMYLVDLVNRSNHFVVSYGKARVESFRMSPDEKKIMVRLGPTPILQVLGIE